MAPLVLVVVLAACGGGKTHAGASGNQDIVLKAKALFAHLKARGVPMSRGPCLGVVAPGWVVDVAHTPRLPVDNLPQNECALYLSGEVKHFVELDPNGNLIRTGP